MIWRAQIATMGGDTEWRAVEAPTRDAAVSRLIGEGLIPLDIRSGKADLVELLNRPITLGRGIPVGEQALFLRQMATLVNAGIPVDRSLDLLAEQGAHKRLRQLVREMLQHVREGGSLGAAFEASKAFPAFVAGVVRAAERGGKLGFALTSIAERLELIASTRRQLVTALSYPAAILFATVAALMLVLTGVVPQFAPLFEGEEARLPLLTRFVLALSSAVLNHGYTLLLIGLGLLVVAIAMTQAPSFRMTLARYRRWAPFMGLRDQYMAGQFASLLGTLLANGLTLVDALPLVRGALGSRLWAHFLQNVERELRAGQPFSAALARSDMVPPTVVRLIEVGEQTGKLGETSLQAGQILSETVKARIERIVALVNPVAIILLGGLVGALVAGVMLGIFAMGDFAA